MMEKYIYDQNNGLCYELQGDYYIPCLAPDDVDAQSIGTWGRKLLNHLREHHPARHTSLILNGRLHSYLVEIDQRAAAQFELLVNQMTQQHGITEQLKAQDQMAWVQHMNNIRSAAGEMILQELLREECAA